MAKHEALEMTDFFRYPHTPHLAWLGEGSPRDDKVLPPAEVKTLLNDHIHQTKETNLATRHSPLNVARHTTRQRESSPV